MKTTRNGFTLIEVLVAISILAGGILIVATSWSGNFLRLRKSNLYNNVAILLERKVTEIQAKYRDKPLEEVVDEEGDFGQDLAAYRWTFKTKEFEMPDLSGAIMGEKGRTDEMLLTMVKQTSEFLSKSIKEGTISVLVKSGKKDVEFSVTTYFIDYNKEFSLPGAGGGSGGGGLPTGGASGSSSGGAK